MKGNLTEEELIEIRKDAFKHVPPPKPMKPESDYYFWDYYYASKYDGSIHKRAYSLNKQD